MSDIDRITKALLLAYIGDIDCTLTNSDCNELTKYITGLKYENIRLQSELKAANEDAERLTKYHIIRGAANECRYCHKYEIGLDDIIHDPDCPYQLHVERIAKEAQS